MRRRATGRVIVVLVAGALAACTAPPEPPRDPPAGITVATTALGEVLVDGRGMTLYTFAGDEVGKSHCYGECAATWPPLFATADVAIAERPFNGWSAIWRQEGARQWSHEGRPLYTYSGDRGPGDISGDGIGSVWYVARP